MPPDFELEPNNTTSAATDIAAGSTVVGTLSSKNDVDWFKFLAGNAGSVTINFKSPAPADHYVGYFTVGLYGSNGNLLKSLSLGADAFLNLGSIPSGGTYYVKVEANAYYSAGEYNVSLNFQPENNPTPGTPKYSINHKGMSAGSTINEGEIAYFNVITANIAPGTSVPYKITGRGLSSADIGASAFSSTTPGGYQNQPFLGYVTLDGNGKAVIPVPIVADNLTEGTEDLTIAVGDVSAGISINDTSIGGSTPPSLALASYTITPSASSINEGATAKFTVAASGISAGTNVAYTITGLSAEDILGGEVNGRVTFDDLGVATISIPIAPDSKTEGAESLTVMVGSASSTITVNDTSKSGADYYISASDGLVLEGKIATFTVSAANAVVGTKLAYTLSGTGINARDIGNGKLSGSVSIGVDSTATITVPIAADNTTEGDEELTLTITGKGVSETITIDDTSTAAPTVVTYDLSAVESSVKEGEEAEFLIETDPSQAGKSFKWSVTGVSTADVVSKKLSGTVIIDDDGTATITIPTATDALTEGNETLTLTVNGQKASVAVLDNNTVTIASVVLESDSQGASALYKLSDGTIAVAEAGLSDGDALEDYVPLKASASKNYVLPKTVVSLITYPDGGYGLLSKTGAVYSEQKFSEEGIAKGKAIKLSGSQLLAKEAEIRVDLDGDGNIGDAIVAVLDEDGDATQEASGLFQTLSGSLVVASTDLGEGDPITDGLMLMASKTKALTLKGNQTVLGLAQKESGNWEILIQSGKAISAQTFDAQTGIAKGKATTLKTAQLDAREYYYNLDLTGDDDISLVGQETMPVGWAS